MNAIKEAIERSISHNETVKVEVGSTEMADAITEVTSIADDCDYSSVDGGMDIWGDLDGESFRLRLVVV
jgi:RNA-binding protein YhbY